MREQSVRPGRGSGRRAGTRARQALCGRVMITFATLCAAYILSQFYRSFLAIVAPDLTRELGLGPAELGALSAAWFGAFALAQFPIGWALDRLGPRRTLGGAMLGAVAGALLFAAANGFSAMMAAMALIGIGCAPVLMASMFVFGRAYPPERFALLSSLVLGIGALGVLAAATPLAYAVEAFGWRASIAAIGILTAAATIAVFLLIKDPPLARRAAHSEASAWRDLVSIMTLKALWPLLPLTFVAYAVVAAERSLWIGPYLLEVHALDAIARGNAILAMSVAMSIGAIAYGPAERLLRSAKLTVLIGSVVAGAAFVALGVVPALSTAAVVVLLSIIGSFGMTYGILMTHARAFFPEHLLGRGITFMNFIFIAGAGLIQAVSGLFVKASAASGTPPVDGFARLQRRRRERDGKARPQHAVIAGLRDRQIAELLVGAPAEPEVNGECGREPDHECRGDGPGATGLHQAERDSAKRQHGKRGGGREARGRALDRRPFQHQPADEIGRIAEE